MPLSDRAYMREDYNPPRYTTILIVVLVVGYLIQSCLVFYGGLGPPRWIAQYLMLSVPGLRAGRVWELVTFQFLHAAPMPWHVLLNCVGLYFFGRPIEERLGSKKFLALYLLSGVSGGLLQSLAAVTLPNHGNGAVVGASAGVCGLLAIFCALDPEQQITSWIYFIPVPLRAKFLLWFSLGLCLLGTLFPWDDIAWGAHLGGLLFGMAYVRWFYGSERLGNWFAGWHSLRRRAPVVKVRFRKTPAPAPAAAKPGLPDELGATEFISKEVDPILEKISARGIHSLTERERKILEAARSKMDKR